MARYKDRPDRLARVLANAQAWEQLRRFARAPSVYSGSPADRFRAVVCGAPRDAYRRPCSCADGGAWSRGRCTRC
jgi:hypothetical protein